MEKQYQERCHDSDHANQGKAILSILSVRKVQTTTLIYVDRQNQQDKPLA